MRPGLINKMGGFHMNKVLIGLVLGVFMCSVPVVEAGKRTREDYEQDQEYMGPVQERDVRSRRDQNQQGQASQQYDDMADEMGQEQQPQQEVQMTPWQWAMWHSRFLSSNQAQQEAAAAGLVADYEAALNGGDGFNICAIL